MTVLVLFLAGINFRRFRSFGHNSQEHMYTTTTLFWQNPTVFIAEMLKRLKFNSEMLGV